MGFFCSPLKPQFLPLRKSYKKSDFLHDRYETQQQVHDLWVIKVYSRRELQWRKENPCCLKACVSDRYQPCSPALLRSQVTTGNAGIKTGNQSKDEITPVAFSQLLGGEGRAGGRGELVGAGGFIQATGQSVPLLWLFQRFVINWSLPSRKKGQRKVRECELSTGHWNI